MTHPPVHDLPREATSTLLNICGQLAQSRHARLAQWAAPVSDALLVRLVRVIAGTHVEVTGMEPCRPLAHLSCAELKALHSVMHVGADASDDESVVEWCTLMCALIVADFYRRLYEQAAIDAKAAVIEAEERRLACQARGAPH